ncbi:MAG: epoxyqueuosine reductase QueH [Alphaproteobacteria bacterium]|nr:epoxyqueuosine reductase QueH [Alphaproteobacteria bacterium]
MEQKQIKLVLVSCCAPCSAGAIKQLSDGAVPNIQDFIVLFFNPNIFPESEYTKRMNEQIKYCEKLGVKYFIGNYNHKDWLAAIRGFESEPERGHRCDLCFKFRFEFAKKFARENGYDAVASVLGVSRHKSQPQVDSAAICAKGDCEYLPIKWDEKLRQQINRESDFYRQNYCGCEFSIRSVNN